MAYRHVSKLSSPLKFFFLFVFYNRLNFKVYDCHLVFEDTDLNISIWVCIHLH